ncbi:polysaccharide deacetylase family protein [Bacillus shivajii]|uniref:polysaccharide deacetylase family protein n=1 Tax=Bacillus shivajii TaxID=1983719 RepID=UPI001CFB0CA7|nr:polysaccharide deacetylase family protein [Bacillus shivajii]UCZ52776.1 polysaccharide deacetylase family protein [Bacillus shivajii]
MRNRFIKITSAMIFVFALLGSTYWIGFAGENGEVEALEQELQASHLAVKELEERVSKIDRLHEENEMLENKLNDKQGKITDLQETIVELEDKIDELENEKGREENSSGSGESNDESATYPEPDGSKTVYLTFDDGPTALTPQILDTLNEYDVNATFFTIGKRMEANPETTRRTYEEGNMILTHSYTHKYSIYESFDTFYHDLQLAEQAYEDVLGFEAPEILRFPGGSANHSSFNYGGEQFMPALTEDIKERGYHYIDWNVSSGDASDIYDQPEKMLNQIKAQSAGKNIVVPLFHDTARNEATAEILPDVIEFYKEEGYEFRTFRDITEEELNKMIEEGIANR